MTPEQRTALVTISSLVLVVSIINCLNSRAPCHPRRPRNPAPDLLPPVPRSAEPHVVHLLGEGPTL